jgi:hypothetical protein
MIPFATTTIPLPMAENKLPIIDRNPMRSLSFRVDYQYIDLNDSYPHSFKIYTYILKIFFIFIPRDKPGEYLTFFCFYLFILLT